MAEKINVSEKKIIKLKEKIAKYTPCSTLRFKKEKPKKRVPDALRIGLFGPPGVGKSSLINSLNFATMDKPDNESDDSDDDTFSWVAIAPEGYKETGSKTIFRVSYQIAEHIEVFDNRGMNQMGSAYMGEVKKQVSGVRHDSERVEWDVGSMQRLKSWILKENGASEKRDIHCTVIVISALNLAIKPQDFKNLIDEITTQTGGPPIVVITHRNHKAVNEEVVTKFRPAMELFGFDHIFEIENYTRDNHKYDAEKHLVLLQILKQCTEIGDRVMKFKEKTC